MNNLLQLIGSKMKWKLMLVISALMLVVVVFAGLIVYSKTSAIIKSDVERLSNQVLKQANLNLERYFNYYSEGFMLMSISAEIESWLSIRKDDKIRSFILFQKIRDNYITPYMYQYPEVMSVTLYNSNGNEINYSTKYGFALNYSFVDSGLESFMAQDNVADVRWSNDYYFEGKAIELPVITLMRKIRYGEDSGYIKIDIHLHSALQLVNELEIGDNGYGFIMNSEGKIIAHPDEAVISEYLDEPYLETVRDQSSGSFFRKETNEIILFGSINYFDWKTVIVVPYSEFASSVYFIREFMIWIAVAGLLLSVLSAVAISSSFTKRIAKLRKMIKDTSRGRINVANDIGGTDEVAELGNAYHAMLEDLNTTVNELADSKVAGQKAVMSALQSQIDSHFLYNTLELINSLASLEGQTRIEQTTIALAEMLRYTSDYKSNVVPIEHELGHLNNYLDIMKMRMGEQLEYDLHVDADVLQSVCLKAILQPVVENCMKHAIPQLDQSLQIQIKVLGQEVDGHSYIEMVVRDNGKGFAADKLSWINEQLKQIALSPLHHSFNNIGLLNIHFRLQMYYQHDALAGIAIRNAEQTGGAEIIIKMPKVQAVPEVNANAV
ncbi:two-component sensor histidine kinase [Paenibacillus agaridevorans]|uniref:Two-component sensor histidine kinase n=1 Tax=Paenibacillus agaridevorans TaxID=171404 RepID=A0A2R5F1W1_9BACL|nr:sensor histidine kinase [Paenibacillus agaridevorans]GBG11508.1 two-component sensor histidine kinase [Paenibacillus agaridevorans]